MASLQDQLLKSGLVDQKKAKQIEKQKRKEAKQQAKGQQAEESEARQRARKARAERAEKDKEANRQRERVARDKAIAAQIRQLVETNRIDRSQGEIAYQFTHGKKIKKLYVTAQLQQQLINGAIAVVNNNGRYELVPAPIAEKIQQRNANLVLVLNTGKESSEPDEDDPYADYQIPDDLMW